MRYDALKEIFNFFKVSSVLIDSVKDIENRYYMH